MLRYCLLLLFFFIHWSAYAQINGSFEDTPLENIIKVLEQEHDCRFSFLQEDVKEIRISYIAKGDSLSYFLDKILQTTDLTFEVVNERFVTLQKKTPGEELSSFCGNIYDQTSKLPLVGANAYLQKAFKGGSSDSEGRFDFSSQALPGDSLIISYVGYKSNKYSIAQWSAGCKDIYLDILELDDNFIVVTEYLTDGIELKQQGVITQLKPERIGTMPGQAQADVMRSLEFLPGITSPDGSAAGLNIRGGTPDQNLILWEGIPIFHAAHYFDMISAFNPDIIQSIDVYRGGFGAQYGGRVSGVIDLKSWTPQATQKFQAGTDGVSGFTSGHIPFDEQKGSITYSLRRSMTELWRAPAFETMTNRNLQSILEQNINIDRLPEWIQVENEFKFLDLNLKASYQVSEKDELSLSFLYAQNNFSDLIVDQLVLQSQMDTLDLVNRGISFRWNHKWSKRWQSRIEAIDSDFEYDYDYSLIRDNNSNSNKLGRKRSAIREQQLRFINTNSIWNHSLELAYEAINYDVGFQFTRERGSNPPVDERENINSLVHVVYGTWSSDQTQKIGYEVGLRSSYFDIKKDLYFEPRGELWYRPSKTWSFNLSAGRYVQWLNQLIEIEGDRATIETPVWVLAGGREVPVVDAQQYQVGLIYRKNGWLLDLQLYRKRMKGISSLTTGFSEDFAKRYNIGRSDISGLDLLLKKRWGDFQSWWSYTLSKVEYTFPTFFDEEFAAPNDQRHNFNWINRWQKGPWQVAMGWKLRSGLPFSPNRDFDLIEEDEGGMGENRFSIRPTANRFNGDRLPWQHQLDASVHYQFQPKSPRNIKTTIGCSFANIYDRDNLYSKELFIRYRPQLMPILSNTDRQQMGFTFEFLLKFEW